jgi:hypothetical protein
MGFGNEVRVGLVEVSTDEAWADALGIGGDGTVEVGRQFVGAKVDSCVDDEEGMVRDGSRKFDGRTKV